MARWRYENGVTNDAGNFVVDNIMVCREMVERGLWLGADAGSGAG